MRNLNGKVVPPGENRWQKVGKEHGLIIEKPYVYKAIVDLLCFHPRCLNAL